eukprot:6474805-Amphidinium_carterae.1
MEENHRKTLSNGRFEWTQFPKDYFWGNSMPHSDAAECFSNEKAKHATMIMIYFNTYYKSKSAIRRSQHGPGTVSYTHLRAHETEADR